jgi:hypothetical protein
LLATGRHANTDRALAVFMTCYNAHLESNVLPEPSNLYTLTGAGRYVGMRQADPEMNTDNDGGNFNTLFFVNRNGPMWTNLSTKLVPRAGD